MADAILHTPINGSFIQIMSRIHKGHKNLLILHNYVAFYFGLFWPVIKSVYARLVNVCLFHESMTVDGVINNDFLACLHILPGDFIGGIHAFI